MVVDFANSTGGRPGRRPAGRDGARSTSATPPGAPKFVGESEIDHTPQGSELALKFGDAFDVTVQPTLVSDDKVNDPHAATR